ncbi:caspase family protein [Lamprocystis purpurea]|jgi:hypothetical protein|uniref:caspase family protein n=1 Tax=Lamprocystis purpurea TaxID=61598 RepID=UPI000A044FF3|nr:caspase family protein [Lamprocystis purpurea]
MVLVMTPFSATPNRLAVIALPTSPTRPRARALLIGLSQVDAAIYQSDLRQGCEGCLQDVEIMRDILTPLGYVITTLTDAVATTAKVESTLATMAGQTCAGDVFLFFYTGHGSQLEDQPPGDPLHDEMDGRDECYCLYDGKWRDDLLYHHWLKFPPGCLIYAFTDSCRSGTGMRNAGPALAHTQAALGNFIDHQDSFPCALLHIAASRDTSDALGGEDGSRFTLALQRSWNRGGFQGNWDAFYHAIAAQMPTQPIQRNSYGPGGDLVLALAPFALPTPPIV